MAAPLIFYIRHGETEWNRDGRLQGQQDSRLTGRGRDQASSCGRLLRDLLQRDARNPDDLDYVASPLGRARASMELIRIALGLAPERYRTDDRLMELAFGRWERQVYVDLRTHDPELLAARERDKWNFRPPGGESYADLMERLRAWQAEVTRDSVVVAHGGVARALMALNGIAPPDKACELDVDQGVIYLFAGGCLTRYA
jgi:broad specificity phosphatase PhoE